MLVRSPGLCAAAGGSSSNTRRAVLLAGAGLPEPSEDWPPEALRLPDEQPEFPDPPTLMAHEDAAGLLLDLSAPLAPSLSCLASASGAAPCPS